MANNFNLTLEPQNVSTATAVQVAEEVAAKAEEAIQVDKPSLEDLTAEEQAAVKEFSEKIDVTDTEQVLNYGSNAQKNISEFTEAALATVKTKNMGEVGDMLTNLVVELKGLDFDENYKGLKRLFKKSKSKIAVLMADYEKADKNVESIVEQLENHEVTLMKDISLMDKMYEKNEEYLKELTMYIIAGKMRIDQLRNVELPKLQEKANKSGLAEDAQEASDFANLIGRFEKQIYNLELTRTISLQTAPQIRLIQNNDSMMIEKIRTSINNTIPLWKNQMVLALTMFHSESAMKVQHEVDEVTNDLLRKNSEKLHQGSVGIAEAAERGIIDLETLQHTNQELINTLDEVRTIQDNGRARRAAAEDELAKIEAELKKKLLEIKG